MKEAFSSGCPNKYGEKISTLYCHENINSEHIYAYSSKPGELKF